MPISTLTRLFACAALVLACGAEATVLIPFEQATHVSSRKATELYNQGIERLNQGELKAAETAFEASAREAPFAVEPVIALAQVALMRNDPAAVQARLDQALKLGPNRAEVLAARGRWDFAQRRFEQAAQALERAGAIKPDDTRIRIALGDVYINGLNQPNKAVSAYRAAIELSPNHAGAHHGLGMSLVAIGQYDEAEAAFLLAAARGARDNPLPWQALGKLRAGRGQLEAALDAYARALEASPHFTPALIGRGDVYVSLDEYQAARDAFEKAIKQAPKSVEAHLKLGMLHQGHGRVAEANREYLATTKLAPDQALAWNNLAWMAAERGESLNRALAWAQRAVDLAPQVNDYTHTLAWVHYARGEHKKALPLLAKVVAKAPARPDFHYYHGIVLSELKRDDEARDAFQTALSLKTPFGQRDDARKRLDALRAKTQ